MHSRTRIGVIDLAGGRAAPGLERSGAGRSCRRGVRRRAARGGPHHVPAARGPRRRASALASDIPALWAAPTTGLAAIARSRLTGFPAAEVVTSSLETWQPHGAPFDAVAAASSLHWIDQQLRYSESYELLRSGGAMAWPGACGRSLRTPIASGLICRRTTGPQDFEGSPPPAPEQVSVQHLPAEAAGLFEEMASLRYPFQVRCSAEDHLANLPTQSGTHALGEARSTEFLARVRPPAGVARLALA